MRKLFFLAAALFSLVAAPPAWAGQWRVAAMSGEAPDRIVFLVDAGSIARDGDEVRFWTQTIVERPENEQDWDRSVTFRQGSCRDSATAILQNSFYNAGRELETDRTARPLVFHQPESLMYGVMQAVCGREAWVTDPVEDPEPLIRAFFRDNP